MLADVGDDIFDRFQVGFQPPGGGHYAKVATVDAGARGFEDVRGQKAAALHQLAAREGTVGQAQVWVLVITRFHLPGGEIAQQFGPGIFGVAGDNGIGVGLGVFGDERDVRPTQHHRDAPAAVVVGQLISADGRAGDNRHADQVGLQGQVNVFDAFVDDFNIYIQFGWDE